MSQLINDKKYLETLGADKIREISDFDYLSKWLLSLDPKEYTILVMCLNAYIEQNGYDNWRDGFYTILHQLRGGYGKELSRWK